MIFGKVNAASQYVSNDCLNAYRNAILKAHNAYRSQHQAPALRNSDSLGATAQKYANYLAANKLFQHSNAQGLGENLANMWSSNGGALTAAKCAK